MPGLPPGAIRHFLSGSGIAKSGHAVVANMKAITYSTYGNPDVLEYGDQPMPKVGPGMVLVRVKAAAVNPVDWKIMAGYLDAAMDLEFPAIPGWDVAGVVESAGIDARQFKPGDEVIAYGRKDYVHGGSFAEYIALPERVLARKPASLGWNESAGLPLAGLTAYQVLNRLGLTAGETVLIHGGSGGVGSLGIQIAVARGASVIATASEKNHDFLRSLGAKPVAYGTGSQRACARCALTAWTSLQISWAETSKQRWRCWPKGAGMLRSRTVKRRSMAAPGCGSAPWVPTCRNWPTWWTAGKSVLKLPKSSAGKGRGCLPVQHGGTYPRQDRRCRGPGFLIRTTAAPKPWCRRRTSCVGSRPEATGRCGPCCPCPHPRQRPHPGTPRQPRRCGPGPLCHRGHPRRRRQPCRCGS